MCGEDGRVLRGRRATRLSLSRNFLLTHSPHHWITLAVKFLCPSCLSPEPQCPHLYDGVTADLPLRALALTGGGDGAVSAVPIAGQLPFPSPPSALWPLLGFEPSSGPHGALTGATSSLPRPNLRVPPWRVCSSMARHHPHCAVPARLQPGHCCARTAAPHSASASCLFSALSHPS